MILKYNEVLPVTLHQECWQQLRKPHWEFGSKSHHDQDLSWMWLMNLDNNTFFTDVLFKEISKLLDDTYELVGVHANCQTNDLPGLPHTDHDDGQTTHSFIYFANLEWEKAWGGRLILWRKENNIPTEHTISPIPNTGVLFDASIRHMADSPNQLTRTPRISVAFKLKKL
jgi:hypothetical protein